MKKQGKISVQYVIVVREDYVSHPIIDAIYESAIELGDSVLVVDWRKISDIVCLFRVTGSKKRILIATDPVVYLLSYIFFIFSRKIFFSLEMFELQREVTKKNKLRNCIFYVSHKLSLKTSDTIVFCNKARYRYYLYKKWCVSEKVIIIENMPSKKILSMMDSVVEKSKNNLRKKLFLKYEIDQELYGKNIFIYAGSLSPERATGTLLDIFSKAQSSILLVAGIDGNEIFKNKHKNIFFLGWLEKRNVLNAIRASDYQVAIYQKSIGNTRFAAPVKAYESIYLGTPMVLNDNCGIRSLSIANSVILYKDIFSPDDIEVSLDDKHKEKIYDINSRVIEVLKLYVT